MAEETTHSEQPKYSWNCLMRNSGIWFVIIHYTCYKCFKQTKNNFTAWMYNCRIVGYDVNEQKQVHYIFSEKRKSNFFLLSGQILRHTCNSYFITPLQFLGSYEHNIQYNTSFFKKKKKLTDTVCLATKSALKSNTTIREGIPWF